MLPATLGKLFIRRGTALKALGSGSVGLWSQCPMTFGEPALDITSAHPNGSFLFQPDFEYAASTFVPTMSAAQKNRLLALWRKAIRCTAGATWQCAVGPLLVELRLSNIEHLWALQLALMVQKCHLGTAPQVLVICKKLNRTKHSHETRRNQSSFTPFRPLMRYLRDFATLARIGMILPVGTLTLSFPSNPNLNPKFPFQP